jgi:hypothetical protein
MGQMNLGINKPFQDQSPDAKQRHRNKFIENSFFSNHDNPLKSRSSSLRRSKSSSDMRLSGGVMGFDDQNHLDMAK